MNSVVRKYIKDELPANFEENINEKKDKDKNYSPKITKIVKSGKRNFN